MQETASLGKHLGEDREDVLSAFHPSIQEWFRTELGEPSEPQVRAWPEIARGNSVLIIAPTGAGKTLAAFLQCIDALIRAKSTVPDAQWTPGVRVLYISPLKALNNDIYRNLEVPLLGIRRIADRSGLSLPEITRAVRTGDTPSSERQRMTRKPPDILITTPESLYLLLTSAKARGMLRTVEYVIVDEIHSVCGTKRGTHLALSLERLVELTDRDPTRIGLSATIEPAELAAAFLGGYVESPSCSGSCPWIGRGASSKAGPGGRSQESGGSESGTSGSRNPESVTFIPRNVKIIRCSLTKAIDVQVVSPVEDYRDLKGGPLWTAICGDILELIRQHRSTLVFVNNRRAAELAAAGINNLAGEEIARSHHGSISKEARLEIETLLKKGELPCLVATSSLELGIDIGAVDLVVQIESPTTIAQIVQRIGRAGHRLDAVSKGVIMTKTRGDLLRCAFAESEMRQGYLEDVSVPESPLDVLAQQIVAAAAVREYSLDELYCLARRAYPYRALQLSHLQAVLSVLSDPDGLGNGTITSSSRPRIVWDSINDRVRATTYGKMLALSHSGTIIDRGYFQVCLAGSEAKLGELEEEFVNESRRGERFTLGTSTWRIEKIERDRVIVTQASGGDAKLPFWRGEGPGRPRETGIRFGRFIRTLQEKMESGEYEEWIRSACRLSECAADNLRSYVEDQVAATGVLPTDRRIVIEHFSDEAGERRILIHCPLGARINAGLGLLYTQAVKKQLGCAAEFMHNDDGVLIHVFSKSADASGLLSSLSPADVRELLLDRLPESPAFHMAFRQCATRALLLTRPGSGSRRRRFPLWIQRLRGAELFDRASLRIDHPVILEAFKECLDTSFDIDGLSSTLEAIEQGNIEVRDVKSLFPSPFGSELLFSFLGAYMYVGDLPRAERRGSALVSDLSAFSAPAKSVEYESLDPRAIEDLTASRLREVVGEVRGPDEVHHALRSLGPIPSVRCQLKDISALMSGDLGSALSDGQIRGGLTQGNLSVLEGMLERLVADGRVCELQLPGWSQRRWAATEDIPILCGAAGLHFDASTMTTRSMPARAADNLLAAGEIEQSTAVDMLVRRFISAAATFDVDDLVGVYPISPTAAIDAIERLRDEGEIVAIQHWEHTSKARWCSMRLYERFRALTLRYAKRDMEPKSQETLCRFVFSLHGLDSGSYQPGLLAGEPPQMSSADRPDTADGHAAADQSSLSRLEHALKMLGGVFLPASWWEDFVLPSRVRSYSPYHLDKLCGSGRIRWVGRTRGSTHEIAILHSDDFFDMHFSEPTDPAAGNTEPDEDRVLNAVRAAGSPSVTDLAKITSLSLHRVWTALEGLVWRGLVSSSEFVAARLLSRPESVRTVLSRPDLLGRVGRWSIVASVASMGSDAEAVIRAVAARTLRRYGLVCKETFEAECPSIPWREAYSYLDRREMAGEYVRGYFVSSLSGIQFSKKEIVDDLRSFSEERLARLQRNPVWVVLAACDPAIPYRSVFAQCPPGLSWSRTQSSAVVFRNGTAVLLASGYGSDLYPAEGLDDETLYQAIEQLTVAFQAGRLWVGRSAMTVKAIGSQPVDGPDATVERMRQMGYASDYTGFTVWRKH